MISLAKFPGVNSDRPGVGEVSLHASNLIDALQSLDIAEARILWRHLAQYREEEGHKAAMTLHEAKVLDALTLILHDMLYSTGYRMTATNE